MPSRLAELFVLAGMPLLCAVSALPALAVVNEPNGLSVPQAAPSNETSLNVFFADRGEAIDWKADASPTPAAFSPLCGFSAEFVFNQSGEKLGLAWYNDAGSVPDPSDLHILVPAGSAVGTTFQGTAIKSDPAYKGGLIGFALVGGETHYTNSEYDNTCTGCNPMGKWVTALMYASKNTPNAYYVCFEDGATGASTWNNDGDFNDDVFLVTGVTCDGGGEPCDTGKPGVCSVGVTQCSPSGPICQQLTQPKTEVCNGIDDNCDGSVDEGDLCQSGEVCDKGSCVKSCSGGEFPCAAGTVCSSDGHCVIPACKDVSCVSGAVCVEGNCKAPCDGVVCPTDQLCLAGNCVDPCAGVTCDQNQICKGGACVLSCNCKPCSGGTACDTTGGSCVDPTCLNVPCTGATHCVAGTCVDNCEGVTCPTGQTCMTGECVATPTGSGGGGGSSSTGLFTTGTGGAGGTASSGGAGGKTTTSSTGSGGSGGSGSGDSSSGCGCELAGPGDGSEKSLGIFALGALAVGLGRASRRRSRSDRND